MKVKKPKTTLMTQFLSLIFMDTQSIPSSVLLFFLYCLSRFLFFWVACLCCNIEPWYFVYTAH
ncbi:hypothetical protein BDV29DRAFT_179213 [Aspergillus leporis]|uniref:Uncharacterized protein n=1 Tax=Aspergillus leporis TaxID=41062 RepID=A0A5N5WWE3_9EURO|nr:hypothetical protein BDV29DRAFT_179213 [Aspergillus leporis]